MGRVNEKVVIITGGGLGIGEAACLLLAKEGAKVAVTDINIPAGEEIVKQIEKEGGTAYFWHMNTGVEKDVTHVFSKIKQKWGKIDVLVNNAGIAGVNKPTHEITEEEWDNLMQVNVKGVFFCTKHAIPYLRENKGGSVINLSSIYGIVSAPDLPAYHASKGAVRMMSKTDALLYAKDNIRVNSIYPGFIWTPLVEKLAQHHPAGREVFVKELASLHPLGHVGEPEDIAYGILYLASDEAKFITGSELVIDGGYTAR